MCAGRQCYPHLVLALGPISGVVQPRPAAQLLLRRYAARLCTGRTLSSGGGGGGGASFGVGACMLLHAAINTPELRRLLTGRGGLLGLRLRLQLQYQVRRRMHNWAGTQRRRRLRGGLAAARGGVPRRAERAPPCCLTPAEHKPGIFSESACLLVVSWCCRLVVSSCRLVASSCRLDSASLLVVNQPKAPAVNRLTWCPLHPASADAAPRAAAS